MPSTDMEWETRPVSITPWDTQPPPTTAAAASTSSSSAYPASRRRSAILHGPPAAPPPSQPIPSVPSVVTTDDDVLHHDPDETLPTHPLYARRGAHPSSTRPAMPDGGSFAGGSVAYNAAHEYARPGASAGLVAVVASSQARLASTPTANGVDHHAYAHPGPSSSFIPSSGDYPGLDDSPPRSTSRTQQQQQQEALHPLPQQMQSSTQQRTLHANGQAHQEIVPDRLLLSPADAQTPTSSSSRSGRPSSRRTLTRALELAREAVMLDSSNDDPHGAIIAYGRSVSLLNEVMDRVMRGEDSTDGKRRNGRRRSVVAQEEEVRRLKSIHDTYADRMNILSLIYSIPPQPHSPTSAYASSIASSASTRPSTPGTHASESSSSSLSRASSIERIDHPYASASSDSEAMSGTESGGDDEGADGAEAIGAAMFTLPTSPNPRASPHSPHFAQQVPPMPSAHPYAVASAPAPVPARAPVPMGSPPRAQAANRSSQIPPVRPLPSGPLPSRPRAASALPPLAPPPQNMLPPTPGSAPADGGNMPPPRGLPEHHSRPRTTSVSSAVGSHRRTGSGGRLESLQEEVSPPPSATSMGPPPSPPLPVPGRRLRARSIVGQAGPPPLSDQPLPPLPVSPNTPRYATPESVSGSPGAGSVVATPRPGGALSRGGSLASLADAAGIAPAPHDASMPPPLISQSTNMGTISQRRKLAGQGSLSDIEADITIQPQQPQQPQQQQSARSTLSQAAMSLGLGGRSRAGSLSGRRPSLSASSAAAAVAVTAAAAPPLPTTNGAPRKASAPSRMMAAVPPSLSVLTPSGPLSPPGFALLPPGPVLPTSLPTTPTSPLPPIAPSEGLRKPYHLMSLLRSTMTTESGGYITRRLHVPREVWSQGGVKLQNLPEKAQLISAIQNALREVTICSANVFGGDVKVAERQGEALPKPKMTEWSSRLDDLVAACDGAVAAFGKKLGVGEGLTLKKTGGIGAFTGKLTRQFDKLSNTKGLDSPAAYVSSLEALFEATQILDEHTRAITAQPVAPVYAGLSPDARTALEAKLRHLSEFFARVVLTFVIRDLSLLLDKYAKKCEKWLEE